MSKRFVELLGAIAFAAAKQRNQRRKDAAASPYINHPLAVAQLLAFVFGLKAKGRARGYHDLPRALTL